MELTIDGKPTRLSTIYQKSPVILIQVFSRCTGVCSPSLMSLKENLASLVASGGYTVIVVSFDPRDTQSDLREFARMLSVENEPGWLFATTKQIDALNASIGFHVQWDEARQQYDHDAMLTGINRQGIIKKKLIGLRDPRAIEEMIREINDGFIASYALPDERKIFSCFRYDSTGSHNRLGTGFLVMLIPAVLTIGLIGYLGAGAKK